jgi:hypothetical protein
MKTRNLEALAQTFKPGQLVEFDGSGDARYPRYYPGTVERVEGGLVYVRHDGYNSSSAVRADRLQRRVHSFHVADFDALMAWCKAQG